MGRNLGIRWPEDITILIPPGRSTSAPLDLTTAAMSSSPPCSNSKTAAAGHAPVAAASRYCLCAPTTHPGSFRCRLHRSSSSIDDATAVVVLAPPSAASEEAKKAAAAAAAAARALLERVTVRKPKRQGVSGTMFLPRPSRLGATATEE